MSIVIIGSGLAGYTLAREFRKLDQTTPLQIITSDDGTYYSKPQLSSAFTHHKTAPALAGFSAEKMAAQLKAEIYPYISVTHIDHVNKIVYAGEKQLAYEKLILAQGAEVIKTTLPENKNIAAVNNLLDYIKFRDQIQNKKRITIIGAGLVGCEFTNDLTNGGYEIDVLSLAKTPLDILLPPELGINLQEALAEKGVRWHFETTVDNIKDLENDQLLLTLTNGETITTEFILSAIGLRPALTLAKTAGINTQRGIVVDRYLKTSVENIYAFGDCAEVEGYVMYYVAPLVNCARALAKTLTGELTAVSYPPMPVILKTPACPIVVNPPPHHVKGEWQISGSGHDKKALFYDLDNQLQGFALTGNCVLEKLELMKELPVLF
jgi:rubredoxin-NAD+ reductase